MLVKIWRKIKKTLYTVGGNANLFKDNEKQYGISFKK